MATKKVTYEDKEAIIPPGIRKNQVQDLDMNELKNVVNNNADELDSINQKLIDYSVRNSGKAYVIWTGVGYVYDIVYEEYYAEGILVPAGYTRVTLSPSDLVNNRIDVFALDSTGGIVLEGTPSADPQAESVDITTQIYITFKIVTANTTQPVGVTNEVVYKENSEWSIFSNTVINPDYTINPFEGTKCLRASAFNKKQYIDFISPSLLNISDYTELGFRLRLATSWANGDNILISFYNGSTAVSNTVLVSSGNHNFSRTLLSAYQYIIIQISEYAFTSGSFDKIRIFKSNGTAEDMQFDNIVLTASGTGISSEQKAITSIVTDSGEVIADKKDDSIEFEGANGITVTSTGKKITFGQNPIANGVYVTKVENQFMPITDSGVVNVFALNDGNTTLSFDNDVSELGTISVATNTWVYDGRQLYIKNNQASSIVIKHNSSEAGTYKFLFPNEQDFVLKPKEMIAFKLRLTGANSGLYNYVGIIADGLVMPKASDIISGTVKTDIEEVDPVVYTKTTSDMLLANKLNTADYNDRFKGVFPTEAALNAAHPTASAGDSAQVNIVGSTKVVNYSWDAEDNLWAQGGSGGSSATNTDELPEGSLNMYFTTARVLSTLLTGISFAAGGSIISTDSILAAFGKLQKQINDLEATYQVVLTATNFGAFINGLAVKTTPIDTDSISIVDTEDANKQKKVSLTNFKAYLLTWLNGIFAPKSISVVETGTSFSLDNSYNGKIVIITASCTVTLPNGMATGFGVTIVTLAGVTLTLALGGSVVLFNNAGTTMAEKLSCTIQNRTTANNYITAGNL